MRMATQTVVFPDTPAATVVWLRRGITKRWYAMALKRESVHLGTVEKREGRPRPEVWLAVEKQGGDAASFPTRKAALEWLVSGANNGRGL